MILDLLAGGKRVGVTANSHKVISNLLTAVCDAADGPPVDVRGIQKANDGDGCPDGRIVQAGSNAEGGRGARRRREPSSSWPRPRLTRRPKLTYAALPDPDLTGTGTGGGERVSRRAVATTSTSS